MLAPYMCRLHGVVHADRALSLQPGAGVLTQKADVMQVHVCVIQSSADKMAICRMTWRDGM